ncbi:hypothetical protein BpHYR1_037197 [Brachionus plicatilis]|uniref:Uncharacterized protein n=1 Tax=Brachionus plicatilis TaxID=10195 RepID=A0A3M7SI56_BRAPC|nr:hypothetical protein BpHYR1_037197 [Brachionus plicatilis]
MDGPHDQTLSAPAITSRIDLGNTSAILGLRGGYVASGLLDHSFLGSQKSHRQQNQITFEHCFTAGHFGHLPSSTLIFFPLDLNSSNSGNISISVINKLLARNLIDPGVFVEQVHGLFVSVVKLEHFGPSGPRVVAGSGRRRLGQYLKSDYVLGSLTQRSAYAVNTSVTTSNHQHPLSLGQQFQLV